MLDVKRRIRFELSCMPFNTNTVRTVSVSRNRAKMTTHTRIAQGTLMFASIWLQGFTAAEVNVSTAAPVVVIPNLGTVQGKLVTDVRKKIPVEAFLGMRYAQPPVGQLRFRNSLAATSKEYKPTDGKNAYDASEFCFECTQDGLAEPMDKGMSEDCLCLNIWRPAGTTTASKLPVYFFIHGGGFIIGAASTRWTDGAHVAGSSNVIVVSINYRLGPLGFLVTDDPDVHGNGGMNGIADQILALKWVQENIGAFGGDASLVTIGGQSSGSSAVCTLGVSPAASGLFSGLLAQSGPCVGPWAPLNTSYGRTVTSALLASLNASSVDDLRKLKAEAIVWPMPYSEDIHFNGFFIDGFVAKEQPIERYKDGQTNAGFVVFGATSMDGVTPYGYTCDGCSPPATASKWHESMSVHWGPDWAQSVEEQYPLERFQHEPVSSFVRADADANVVCPSYIQARLAAKVQGTQVYAYLYEYNMAHIRPCDLSANIHDDVHNPIAPGNCTVAGHCGEVGWASHGTDIPLVFGTQAGAANWDETKEQYCTLSADDEALVDTYSRAWEHILYRTAPWSAVNATGRMRVGLLSVEGLRMYDLGPRNADCATWAARMGLPW
eukprot:m.458130 g.458130  ORF g.458130 m.458130 type:complete len:606 (-) comp21581_c0_seq1:234-2051(-)